MQMPIYPNENDKYEIGQNIRKHREALGLSQDELAARMGIDRNVIYHHENGICAMNICALCQYADALETDTLALSPKRFNQSSSDTPTKAIMKKIEHLTEENRNAIMKMIEFFSWQESTAQQN